MGDKTDIEWCDASFQPWIGCQRVSPGCEHCYAEAYDKRVGGAVDPATGKKSLRWGPSAPRIRTSEANWKKPLKWNREAEKSGKRLKVFCSSLADVFEDRPELSAWRFDLFSLIRQTPQLDWLLLTKRPESIAPLLELARKEGAPSLDGLEGSTSTMLSRWLDGSPPPNVWLGTTVEDQARCASRMQPLLAVPAVVHFASLEPLLGPVRIATGAFWEWHRSASNLHRLNWAIIGGESGGKARPFDLAWVRALLAECRAAGVAPFVKQLGTRPIDSALGSAHGSVAPRLLLRDHHGGDMTEWPDLDLKVREFPVVRP